MQIPVVFHHARKKDIRGSDPVKRSEIFCFKCLAKLNGTIASEIIEHHGVAIFDRANGFAIFRDHKWGQVLVCE